MLWPSRIFTICTLCWCALCFVSLSLLWQLQWFGLMQGCFTKFYLPLLTMNWTTHSIWHSFPYQHSHGNQGKHRTLSSTHCWQSGTSSGALQIFFWRKNHHTWPCFWSSLCLCVNAANKQLDWTLKVIHPPHTSLWSSWLKCWSSYYTTNEGLCSPNNFGESQGFFSFQA